jgi:hypothetical protein
MTINVTQDHIDNGKKGTANRCPIALAIKDAFGPAVRVYVSITAYQIGPVKDRPLPPEAITFIQKYDRGSTVKPFSFEITD